MSGRARLESGLASLLGVDRTDVTVVGAASVGAQRRTVLIDVDLDGGRRPLVAQISQMMVGEPAPASTEAALVTAAAEAGVQVPEVVAVSDDPAFVGGPVMVSERVDGLTIPRQILRSIGDDAAAGDRLAGDCGAALAALHSIQLDDLPAVIDRPEPAGVYRGYVDDLEASIAELPEPVPVMRLGFNWLRRNAPRPPGRLGLVHGDCRNGNIIVNGNRLAAMIDWELAHVGDPTEDLAWLCLRSWRFGNDDRPVGGFGTIDALRAGYESGGGAWDDERFRWWTVARVAWWGIGLARQATAFRAGLSDSIVLAASGRRVVELEYDLLRLIEEN